MNILVCGDVKGYTREFTEYFHDNNNAHVIFGDLLPIITDCDLSVYNQEFPITTANKLYSVKKSGRYAKHSPAFATCIANAGFKLATFANNHTLDYGMNGLRDTIAYLSMAGVSVIGAGEDVASAKQHYRFDKDGVSVSVLSYAETQYNTVGIAHGGANPLDIVENVQDIQRLKAQSDHVIVIIHGGTDFCPYPSPRMVKQYRFYIDAGASAVFNHHQHVPSGYEVYKGRPIFYGLANILPGKIVHPRCINGIAVACQIEKHSLQWEMIPLRFNHQLMRIELLAGHELLQFRKEIDEISQFISNDYLLRDKYGEFLDDPKVKASYNLDFNKKSRLLFRLAKKAGLVDCYIRLYKMNKFANNTSNSRVWNLLRCESHRDALGHYFESDIDTQKMV